jgi:hypothetical protein
LALLQVTRRKGETNTRHHRSNGYAPKKPTKPHPPKALAISDPLEFQKNPAVLSQGSGDEPVVNLQDA